jgi:thiol-disulfide isomerase/thioredoxin
MNRRQALVGGAALAAGAAGVGVAWWRGERPGGGSTGVGGKDGGKDGTAVGAQPDVWSLRFEQPGGGELALATLRGQLLLLNFWATWCPPCVTEMPLLDRFQREHRTLGWQVVGLAVDSPTPVREFLARQPMGFSIGLAGLEGIELARGLGNRTGALPFSVAFGRDGQVARRKLGVLHDADLAAWVAEVR